MEDLPVRRSRSVGHGRYRLGQRLGRGGAAEVYWARDTRLDRPVAVKLFRLAGDAASRARFEREARLLASLSHPNLVTVLDAGEQDDQAFLVMQLVEAGTLRQRLNNGVLCLRETMLLGVQVAGALAYVHARGIIHRDVKPSNILLDTDGSAHLADFGLSRVLGSTHLTESGQLVGTPGYLAPEQVTGAEVAPAADIYALGLVLLECLRGEPEYTGTNVEIAVARLHREPHVPTSLPPALAGLLSAMTATAPKTRPTALECVRRLRELNSDLSRGNRSGATLTTVPVPQAVRHLPGATEDSPARPHDLPGRAGRRWALGGVAASLAAATVVAVSVLGPETKSPQSTPSQPQGSSTLPTSDTSQPDTESAPAEQPAEQHAADPADQPTDHQASTGTPDAPPPAQTNETVTVYQTTEVPAAAGPGDDSDATNDDTADSGTDASDPDNGGNGNGSGDNEDRHKSKPKGRG